MLDILSITGPIYLVIGLGFAVTRLGLFAKADMRVFGKFVVNLALPALLFNALSQRSISEILNFQYMVAYAVAGLMVVLFGFVWARWLKHESMSYASVFAMGMGCPNSGFVGYPVALLTLGSATAGVSLALNMIVENLLLIPLLLALADAGDSHAAKRQWHQILGKTLIGLARNPMILAIVAGLLASLLQLKLPAPFARTVDLFSQASGALSLLVIGGGLVGLQMHGMRMAVAQITLGKLLVHPTIMLAVVLWVAPIDDSALKTAVLLTCAMPIMGIYAILSQRHGHEGVGSAAMLATTVMSFFTLSGMLWAVQQGLIR